jgi:hypothetical protein
MQNLNRTQRERPVRNAILFQSSGSTKLVKSRTRASLMWRSAEAIAVKRFKKGFSSYINLQNTKITFKQTKLQDLLEWMLGSLD